MLNPVGAKRSRCILLWPFVPEINVVPQRTDSVSFRLPAPIAKELATSAETHRTTPNRRARDLVNAGLENTETEELRRELLEIRTTLDKLREDLATAVTALLVNAGKTQTDEAKEWVRRTLLR